MNVEKAEKDPTVPSSFRPCNTRTCYFRRDVFYLLRLYGRAENQ